MVTAPLDLGFVGIQCSNAPGLSSTLSWVQDSNLNLCLELNTGLGAISPCVVSKSLLGAWTRTWRGWSWSRLRADGREPWTRSSAVVCGGVNCGIPMTGGHSRVVSGSCGSRAGSGAITCWKNCDISVTGGSGPVAGSRACCAFCGCRCHREGWQESSSFFVRTVFPCSLGYKQSQQDQAKHFIPHGRAAQESSWAVPAPSSTQ